MECSVCLPYGVLPAAAPRVLGPVLHLQRLLQQPDLVPRPGQLSLRLPVIIPCNMSRVTCHMSRVTVHLVSRVLYLVNSRGVAALLRPALATPIAVATTRTPGLKRHIKLVTLITTNHR